MKIYKNQTQKTAENLEFRANFAFASDENMSPDGIDIMKFVKNGTIVHYEITKYDKETKTAQIMIMNKKEYEKFMIDNYDS